MIFNSTLIQSPVYVLSVLCLIVFLSELLVKNRIFQIFGTALLVIIIGAILANLGIIPTASNAIPLYDVIFEFVTPLALFFLLLEVNLKSLREAGLPLLFMFIIGALGTSIGALIAIEGFGNGAAFGTFKEAIAGMFTGTYIGGSINFNAVALHYKVMDDPALFAGAVAVDNIITTTWMVVCIVFPVLLNKFFPRRESEVHTQVSKQEIIHEERETMSTTSLGLLLFMGIISLFISFELTAWFESIHFNVPFIITLTTIAVILAQFKAISLIEGSRLLGIFGIYLFLTVIGAFCELSALANIGNLAIHLIIFAGILVLIHGIIIFGLGALTKYDWKLISIASQANIGGQTTAIALAKSFKRNDLIVPAVLVGSFGNALGTYLGFIVASIV